MPDYYENNAGFLLKIKPKNYFSITIVLYIILFYLGIFSCVYKVVDYQEIDLLVTCDKTCEYSFYSSLEDTQNIQKATQIIINKNNYPFTIKEIGQVQYDSTYHLNYQVIKLNLKLPKKYQVNNLYLKAKIKIKEEKLIKKVEKFIIERE